MRMLGLWITFFALIAGTASASQEQAPKEPESTAESPPPDVAEPVVTSHEATISGRVLKYSVTTGMLPVINDENETEAHVFFMAYVADRAGDRSERPLTFSFNGGPGSSSVWLHLGALGPRRVEMLDDGGMPGPPYRLVDNEHSWLDLTDMVFIDPVGTGYSRAVKEGEPFWGVDGDIRSVGEFIRLYLTRYERWTSPLFLVGESYGTTRAAGLTGHLVDRGIAFNGVILVSSILNFQTARFTKGNDLPYLLFLPTFTATAWYHKKLGPDLQADLRSTLDEVETWAGDEYWVALAQGDRLSPDERNRIAGILSRFTGLSEDYIERTNLRIEASRFRKELLRSENRTVGRLDSRFKGVDTSAAAERPDFDPSMAAIRPPYTAAFNDYVRQELGYENDRRYYILGGGFEKWEWGSASGGFPDTSEALRSAMAKNPYMKVFVASGYYDMAPPYSATEYTLSHLELHPSLRGNISTGEYEAGHMMYIQKESLEKLKADVTAFIEGARANRQPGATNVP